jgi:cytochrome c
MSKGRVLALSVALAIGLSSAAALAAGDAKEGAKVFKKRCSACHTVTKGGKNKVGPNLFAIHGNKPGQAKGYKYSPSYKQAAGKGLVWDDDAIAEYLKDPRKFIRKATGDTKAKTKMSYKLRKAPDRDNIIAYLKEQK